MKGSRAPSKAAPTTGHTTEALRALAKVANNLDYPINSFADLAKKTKRMEVNVGAITVDVPAFRHLIPAYYFPIASKENLFEKAFEVSSSGSLAPLKSQFRALPLKKKQTFPVRVAAKAKLTTQLPARRRGKR